MLHAYRPLSLLSLSCLCPQAAEVEKHLSTQVHSLRDDFKEKSISTNQHMTSLETLQAEVRHYGMWNIVFAVSHDTKIYIYILQNLLSSVFLPQILIVSCTKQQGLEVSASSFLHVGFVMWWSHCALWNAAGSYLDCFMSALMNVKDGSVTGSWRLCCDTGFTDRHHWTRSKLNFSINTSQEMSLYEDMWICRWTPKHRDLLLLSEYRLKSAWFRFGRWPWHTKVFKKHSKHSSIDFRWKAEEKIDIIIIIIKKYPK